MPMYGIHGFWLFCYTQVFKSAGRDASVHFLLPCSYQPMHSAEWAAPSCINLSKEITPTSKPWLDESRAGIYLQLLLYV